MEKREFIDAGRIVNTHGVAGEVKIEVWLDSPKFFRSFKRIYLGEREMKVVSARTHKDFVIAKLEGIDDINAAMALKGREVTVRREDAALPHGAFFLQDILGARVVDEDGNEIGELVEIMERPASNVYRERGDGAPDPRRAGVRTGDGRGERRHNREAYRGNVRQCA